MKERKTIGSLIPLLRLHKWAFPAIVVLGLLQSLTEGIGIGLVHSAAERPNGRVPTPRKEPMARRHDGWAVPRSGAGPPAWRSFSCASSLPCWRLRCSAIFTTSCSHGSTETSPMICGEGSSGNC